MVTQKKLSKEFAGIATGWPLLNKIVNVTCACVSIAWMLYLNGEPCTMYESKKKINNNNGSRRGRTR